MYIKQVYNEKSKKYNSSGIHKTRYHNDSYLLLLGKKKQQSFEISYNPLYIYNIINTGLATLFLI